MIVFSTFTGQADERRTPAMTGIAGVLPYRDGDYSKLGAAVRVRLIS